MRKVMTGSCVALVLALAGCGGGDADAPREAANTIVNEAGTSPEETGNAIESLTEGQRNAVFIRAIQDAGQQCQHVESSRREGEYQGNPVWKARCLGGVEWTIVIGSDGIASVLNPAEAALMGNQSAAQNDQGQ